jgi:resuscitation-promoting factor RpfB
VTYRPPYVPKVVLYLSAGAIGLILSSCSGQPHFDTGDQQEPTATSQTPTAEPSTATPPPTIETRRVTETQEIPFQSRTVNDRKLAQGTQKTRTQGVVGVKTLTYEVTLTNGVQTEKKLISETVTKPPITEVIAIGTKPASRCDPNYSGACVPIASDVDCAGGSGNGPAYVQGPVRVIGRDIYDLDRDGDGWGCES